jgi:Uma2 family endonuclease
MGEPVLTLLPEDAYLRGERDAQQRHEYVDGRVFAMTGASRRQNIVTLNIGSCLHAHLRGRPCEAFVNDMRVHVGAARAYYYPDVVVSCDERDRQDDELAGLEYPTLVVEVHSASTEAIDRREKWVAYRQLESLQEYVLVDPTRSWIEVFRRTDRGWVQALHRELGAELELQRVGLTVPLSTVYEGITLDDDVAAVDA